MYHPTTRVLAVLALLRAHGRMTGAELAQRLEVDVRTLRRYVTMLQDLGVPLVAQRGRAGAYELEAGHRLPSLMFTNDEMLALSIGLLAARGLGLAEIVHAVESAQAKLEEAVTPELQERVRALAATISLDLSSSPSASSGELMLTLSSAAHARRQLRIGYRPTPDRETERDFDPYGLAFRQGCWYVVGYCHLRRGLRSFRVDRMTKAQLTGASFERPAEFDAMRTIVLAIATIPRRFSFEVLLRTDLATARQEVMDVLGVLEPRDEGVLLRGTADDLDWLARQLARFSFEFEVREPEDLRAALGVLAAKLALAAEQLEATVV